MAAAILGVSFVPMDSARAQTVAKAPGVAGVTVNVRRITESQYRHAIADVFSPEILLNARFEPEKREDGLLAIGSSQLSLTSSGFEQYFALANSISDQVIDPKRREALVKCQPVDARKADDACARAYLSRVGADLFRRPITAAELQARLKVATVASTQQKDFYQGLKLATVSLLMDPDFLFRVERAEADPAKAGAYRLDAYSKASRISYLLWDAAPDAALTEAARSGALHTDAGLKQQLARMTASPRIRDGARAFFIDMLQLDGFDNLVKDPAVYPKFNQSVSDSAREQTLKTVIDLTIDKNRDYRDIFTSNETFINRYLAAVYKVPYASKGEWAPYTFPASSERAGIVTQVSFLSMFAHPAGSSPTRRGVKVHEIFMCEPTPDPPADVDFSKVQAMANGTVRMRLLDHMSNPGCTVCHRRSDPAGLSLEHFDGLGQLRLTENDAPIDVSAELEGKTFTGAAGLASYLHDSPKVSSCLVRNVYSYGLGRKTDERDEAFVETQTKAFVGAGHRVPALLGQIAATPEFLKATLPPAPKPAPAKPL